MNDTPTVDPNEVDHDHILTQDEWDQVVIRAEEIYLERFGEPGGGAGDYAPPAVTPRYLNFPNEPYDKSGTLKRTQLYVIHTAECPLRVGYAASLTEWADGDSYNPRVSWRAFVDPATVALFIPRTEAGWHAAGANPLSLGYEQSGYASYTREQWLSPDGLRQIDLLGEQMVKDGLPKSGVRWLSDAQVLAILQGKDTTTVGLCTHEQISRLLGRFSRTDPGKGYPMDVLLAAVAYYAGVSTTKPAIPAPKPSTALVVDGALGPATIRRWQRVMGTQVDGVISRPSELVRAVQRHLNRKGARLVVDGKGIQSNNGGDYGPTATVRALQRYLGTTADGVLSHPSSNAVKALQRRLNTGRF